MSFLVNTLVFFWFLRSLKFILFWIYLWQLKSYHIWRFLDHFRTYKGQALILNFLFLSKIILFVLILISDKFVWFLILIYFVESLLLFWSFLKGRLKKPVFTFKAVFLTLLALIILVIYALRFYKNSSALLVFDIFLPIIVSLVVLIIQPIFFLLRKRILKKAQQKINQYSARGGSAFGKKNLIVIGITGSYGKTSTKEFLKTILSAEFNVLATPEHKNSEMGIAQTILEDLNEKHQVFIVEMGAYQKGGIKLLCDMVSPQIGVVTGVNQQHLATFGSLENLLSAEGGKELLESLPKDGTLVVNGDNSFCLDLYKKATINKELYCLNKNKLNADLWAEEIMINEDSISFILISKKGEMQNFKVNVLGRQQVQNLLGAILVAKSLGMSFEKISDACKIIRQEQGGMVLKQGIYGIKIIDSSYSSNPDGVMADLDYLSVFSEKKALVMPCLIELGKDSLKIHRQIGEKIAKVCDLAIITTKDYFEEIKTEAMKNGMPAENILLCDKTNEILAALTSFCREKDVILLEGRVSEDLVKKLKNDK